MELLPSELIDISSRRGGILDLASKSINGSYELRQYLCGDDSYKVLFRGNYTDIPLVITRHTCIKVVNISPEKILFSHYWSREGPVNGLLISTLILYIVFLMIIGISICVLCGVSGRVLKWIYMKKFSYLFTQNTCPPPYPEMISSAPPLQVCRKPLPMPPEF